MSYKLVPTILSGGVGSRLWPVSREQHPKPFMRLNDGLSFLQKAFLRGGALPHVTDLMMVTNREFLFKSEDEFRKLVAIDAFSLRSKDTSEGFADSSATTSGMLVSKDSLSSTGNQAGLCELISQTTTLGHKTSKRTQTDSLETASQSSRLSASHEVSPHLSGTTASNDSLSVVSNKVGSGDVSSSSQIASNDDSSKSEIEVGNSLSLTFILEPFGRNTAPAIALACLQAVEKFGRDTLLLILPADHLIENQLAFSQAVEKACTLALDKKIVTFGIKPDKAETGYGYIESKGSEVVRFIEKPSQDKADQYIKSDAYSWNSGMFCFQAETMLNELLKYVPEIVAECKKCFANATKTVGSRFSQVEILAEDFEGVISESIDYAVMESTSSGAVVGCDIGWSDIGNWGAIGELLERDDNNNRIKGDVVLSDSRNCIVHGDERLIAAIGLEDITIIDTPDALLISHNSQAQNVKEMYAHLKGVDHKTYKHHETVYRPWGSYTVLSEGDDFKMKRIEVEPGASLSLQSHDHRNEHWVVVSGTAKVRNGEKTFLLNVNDSTYIPAGCVHRAENHGHEKLVFIEVQTGSYLGEDDIKRFEDVYGRAA